ncbi:hypothetical protein AcW1_006812 [Taiwanofungus camphoratus]|nr:hypothetical protein AcW1_006812 [Antrodia cinnamomea]
MRQDLAPQRLHPRLVLRSLRAHRVRKLRARPLRRRPARRTQPLGHRRAGRVRPPPLPQLRRDTRRHALLLRRQPDIARKHRGQVDRRGARVLPGRQARPRRAQMRPARRPRGAGAPRALRHAHGAVRGGARGRAARPREPLPRCVARPSACFVLRASCFVLLCAFAMRRFCFCFCFRFLRSFFLLRVHRVPCLSFSPLALLASSSLTRCRCFFTRRLPPPRRSHRPALALAPPLPPRHTALSRLSTPDPAPPLHPRPRPRPQSAAPSTTAACARCSTRPRASRSARAPRAPAGATAPGAAAVGAAAKARASSRDAQPRPTGPCDYSAHPTGAARQPPESTNRPRGRGGPRRHLHTPAMPMPCSLPAMPHAPCTLRASRTRPRPRPALRDLSLLIAPPRCLPCTDPRRCIFGISDRSRSSYRYGYSFFS